MNIDVQHMLQELGQYTLDYAPKLAGALAVLVVGWILIGWIQKYLRKFFDNVEFDEALETFLQSLIGMILKVILIVIVISMLGVQTSSLVAILGAASLAVGLALQGSLSNFAGGVLILIFKPFRVGDFIEAQGVNGTVEKIEIFNTILSSLDNKKIVLPNGNLSNDVITNFTAASTRRHEFNVGIGYADDILKAKQIIEQLLQSSDFVMKNPEPTIGVGNLGASSVDIQVRFWVNIEDYRDAKYWFLESVKAEFDKDGISIPFPQTDVHLYHEEK